MKRILLLPVVFLACGACAGPAAATVTPGSGGAFLMYADPTYTSWDLTDSGPSLQVVYIRHELISCVTGGRFKIEDHGYTGVWVSDDALGNEYAGNSQTGIALSYGGATVTPYAVLNVTYLGSGTTPTCSYLIIVADPSEPDGVIAAVDCSNQKHAAAGGVLCVNPDVEYCNCQAAVEPTSWSRVKALYR